MRDEIEAAALFITRLVNKNLLSSSNSAACSSASSTHSSSSSSSSSSTSSESPPGFDDQSSCNGMAQSDLDKVEQFRQCLTKALYERFHDHWFPEQPTKGQAYRCIRLNPWDRHDIPLQAACMQCGIDYKDLQLPVELTLWVDPDEVTCRFGENKGSHCLVAKFKDGELRDDNFNLDINNIDIEIFRQETDEKVLHANSYRSPECGGRQHNYNSITGNNIMNNGTSNLHHNSSYNFIHQSNNNNSHYHHHHQQPNHQPPAQQTPQHHRTNMGKTAIFPSYHHSYSNGCDNNGNPIYYFFN